jgi:hypothetical protein
MASNYENMNAGAAGTSTAQQGRKKIAVVQSNYIPWKGYFDLIRSVDEFILYDDAQYTCNDWRNRNLIKTPKGTSWLSIPVHTSGRFGQRIRDAQTTDSRWAVKHWKSLMANYSRARYFELYRDVFAALYERTAGERSLSRINYAFITALCNILKIRTTISWSWDYQLPAGKSERLLSLCRQTGATAYLSGPAARAYVNPQIFADAGIELCFVSYVGYPEYDQLFPPFDHNVSVIDLLFNQGPNAIQYMKPGKRTQSDIAQP